MLQVIFGEISDLEGLYTLFQRKRESRNVDGKERNQRVVFLDSCLRRKETLDRGVGRLQRFEAAHGSDQQLELAVVGLNDVVEVLHLPVPRLVRAFALGFQLFDGRSVGRGLVGVQHLSGSSQSFNPLRALPRNRFAALVLRVDER